MKKVKEDGFMKFRREEETNMEQIHEIFTMSGDVDGKKNKLCP